MVRRSKIIIIIFTLMLIFLITITPLLVAPSIATYRTNESSNLSYEASSWFDESFGEIFSDIIMLSLLPINDSYLPSGIFSFRRDSQNKIQFGIYYPELIEFNDTNENYMFDKADLILKNVSLNDFNWTFQPPSFNAGVVTIPLVGIKYPTNIIKFKLNLYLTTQTVTLSEEYPDINFTVPGGVTIKTIIQISGYNWTEEDSNIDYDYRMLALKMALRSEVNPGNQKHLFQLANGAKVNSSDLMSDTIPVPFGSNMNVSSISLVNLNNILHGELNWFNNATEDDDLIPMNSSFMTNGTDFNLYLSVPYFEETLVLDPSYSMHNPPSDNIQEIIQSIFLSLPYYTPSIGLLSIILLGSVSTAALIIGAVYYLRKKRI